MPTTDIEGPNSHADIGTDIGDGVNYASISSTQRNRVLETSTGANAMAATATPSGVLFKSFFNANQIPAGATILGVEVIGGTDFDGSGEAFIGSFGSSTSTFDVECYLHNGTSYSSKLTWDNSVSISNFALSNSDTTAEFDGGNVRYKNNTSGDDVLFGGPADLAGLSWDPANQSDFGFALTFQNEAGSMVAGTLRGLGLRVTYKEAAAAEKINTLISGSIVRLDTVAGNLIKKFNGLLFTGATPPPPPGLFSQTYQFEDQTTQESSNAVWAPVNASHNRWENGVTAVTDAEPSNTGTNWGKTATKQVKGWNLGQDTTTSSNTGPNGGVNPADGSHDTSSDGDRYLYCETSTGTGGVGGSLAATARTYVTRMPGFNFSTEMLNTGADLNLKFWLHAFGNQIGDLFIYIDTNDASNHSTATLIQSYTTFSGFTANSSVWQQQTVSLNSYRGVDAIHYIYFVYEGATGFRGDLAIDGVQLIEEEW